MAVHTWATIKQEEAMKQLHAIPPKSVCVSAGDYFNSVNKNLNDVTGAAIDNGGEPYLIDAELATFGMHAQVVIYDVARHLTESGLVEFEVSRGCVLVDAQTLVVLL